MLVFQELIACKSKG